MSEKVAEYLSCGVPLVVLIDPDEETATVFRPATASETLGKQDLLELGE